MSLQFMCALSKISPAEQSKISHKSIVKTHLCNAPLYLADETDRQFQTFRHLFLCQLFLLSVIFYVFPNNFIVYSHALFSPIYGINHMWYVRIISVTQFLLTLRFSLETEFIYRK